VHSSFCIAELQSVTCHMGSVAQVNALCLNPRQSGRHSIYTPFTRWSWLNELARL